MILLMPVLVYHLGYDSSLIQGIFFSTLLSGILVAFLRFMVYRTNKDYVNTRTDMLDIEKHHGKRFLVAEGDKGEILGTIVYVEEPKITYFKVKFYFTKVVKRLTRKRRLKENAGRCSQ